MWWVELRVVFVYAFELSTVSSDSITSSFGLGFCIGLDISFFSGAHLLFPRGRLLRLLYQKQIRSIALNTRTTGATIAAICPMLSLAVVPGAERAALVIDAVAVAVPVDACVLEVVVNLEVHG